MESEIGLCSRAHIFIVVDCDVIILFLYNFAENHRLRIDLNDEREKSTLIENEIILPRELNLIYCCGRCCCVYARAPRN